MNILKLKRQQFVDELARLAVTRETVINEKVAAYRASLESENDDRMSILKANISAIDVLIENCSTSFEYELVQDSVQTTVQNEHIVEDTENVQEECHENDALPECFKRTSSQRPGMLNITTPTRH